MMRSVANGAVVTGLALATGLIGCGSGDEGGSESQPAETRSPSASATPPAVDPHVSSAAPRAQAVLTTPDGTVLGQVAFAEEGGQVHVDIVVRDVAPGTHGIHLHETGDCSNDDFTSAGGHFNPHGSPHGGPRSAERHAGDFGNILVNGNGSGRLHLHSDLLTVSPGPNSVIGRAMILHAEQDDLASQPSGAAGARIACGVVEVVEG